MLCRAVEEILTLALRRLPTRTTRSWPPQVEPLEQVIDALKEQLRTRHILRMQQRRVQHRGGLRLVRTC